MKKWILLSLFLTACSTTKPPVITTPCLDKPVDSPELYSNEDLRRVGDICERNHGAACGAYVDMLSSNEGKLRQYALRSSAAMKACVGAVK